MRGLEDAEERVAALGAEGVEVGKEAVEVEVGLRARRACGMSWWARGLGGCFRSSSVAARCCHYLRRLC